ncbi:MAG: hypothetical protein CMH64_00590 [Nanoarchaeota archaeon]|nr:hypothetical protein [Nanoarchaeota archaeon]|tara:strand:- start:456 stop:839 length:384 start_codon:yes stop_codon:yes gene_type:complete
MVTTKPLRKTTPQKRASPKDDLIKDLAQNTLQLQGKIVDLVQSNNQLLKSQTNTSKEISSMVQLFREAGEHMVAETEEEKLRPLLNKISELVEQNKTIMRGLILIQKYIKSTTMQEIPQKPMSPEEF